LSRVSQLRTSPPCRGGLRRCHGPSSTSSTSVVIAVEPYRQHPPGGPPLTFSTSVVVAVGPCRQHRPRGSSSTSSTSVVAAVGPCRQHPQGDRHRCLQLRWWPLLDLTDSTPRGPAIDVFNFRCGRCRICHQHLPGDPSSMYSTSVVAAARPAATTPRGLPSTSPTSELPAPTPPGGAAVNIS
jgi:hypothetical protein